MSEEKHDTATLFRFLLTAILSIVTVGVFVTLVRVLINQPQHEFELDRGGIFIETEADIDVFINNTHLGRGPTYLSWNELLRNHGEDSLGIRTDLTTSDTESLIKNVCNESCQVIWRASETPGWGAPFDHETESLLIRRKNGMFDYLSLVDAQLNTRNDQQVRFLIPIRLRSKSKPIFPTPSLSVELTKDFFGRAETIVTFEFQSHQVPADFPAKKFTDSLWQPAMPSEPHK